MLAELVSLKIFDEPDEIRTFEKGRFEIVRFAGISIGRATYQPGWRWSLHIGPGVGAARCLLEHLGYVVSGVATAAFDDGSLVELRPGQVFHIPAEPHDSWVVGDEPYVSLHLLGASHYAIQLARNRQFWTTTLAMADIVTLTKMAIEALDRKDPALLLSSGLAGDQGRPMGPAIYHVNAFCGRGAAGNPGAVCLLDDSHSTEWMQEVAAQMNLSETGFVQRLDTGDFALRWFSPRQEMPLCGHVTLGAAHVIWVEAQLSDQAVLRFETASGALHASRGADGIEIALPINLCTDVMPPTWFRDVFAVEPKRALAGDRKYLIELASAAEVLGVRPNFDLLRRVADRGVILTARSASSGHDIVSRYFASYVGVDEDPATGSAHCCLVPYWSERLGKPVIRAWQASARGGNLIGRCIGDEVHLTGQARTVLAGELRL